MDKRSSRIRLWTKRLALGMLVSLFVLWVLPVPKGQLAFSTVVLASDHSLLGARVAEDGQWRFPIADQIPERLEVAITLFEDEYFFRHPGINPFSIYRAINQNIKEGRIVSGGSTITMQLARILRGNRSRTIGNKMIEMVIALQIELKYSKKEILKQYAGLAPFGGNVVGVDAASWRYFGRSSDKLSWAEAATLAVLPNAPSLIHPGKNRILLEKKRNRLLAKLNSKDIISDLDYELSTEEPLPLKPFPLPNDAQHLLDELAQHDDASDLKHTTIDAHLQRQHLDIASRYHDFNHDNGIHNLAIITADIESGAIKSYVANSDCDLPHEGVDVNIINAPRSSGSILKPLLYAAAYEEGLIAPQSLLPDIPTKIAGFTPKNFDRSYAGAVRSEDALTKSLNIPAVRLLQKFGLTKFHEILNQLEFSTINQPADHYGLSLILGGAEVTLFDVVNVYRKMAGALIGPKMQTQVSNANSRKPAEVISYLSSSTTLTTRQTTSTLPDPPILQSSNPHKITSGAIHNTLEILSNLERPRAETGWKSFSGNRKIAWKTGTSFGHRDAWAIGMDGTHIVGVWVGNADGEGRPGLTGLSNAAPILFDVFDTMESGKWFPTPYDDIEYLALCQDSGYRAGRMCSDTIHALLPLQATALSSCDFHTQVSTDLAARFQVDPSCYPADEIIQKTYFTLPAVQAYYYRKKDPRYTSIPPLKKGCIPNTGDFIDIIYPFANADIAIPKDLNGEQQELVFSAAHADPNATLHWHIDDQFIGTTSGRHEVVVDPALGEHLIHIVDQNGVEERRRFEVVE